MALLGQRRAQRRGSIAAPFDRQVDHVIPSCQVDRDLIRHTQKQIQDIAPFRK